LSGASDTTERLSLRWSPIPSAVLRLVTHAPLKWRAAVLTTLMVTALVLLYVSRSPSPVAAPLSDAGYAPANLDQILADQPPARPTPVVNALGSTRPEAGRAGASLGRAESLYAAGDWVVARLAALDAEQVGVAAGVAPPSPQPAEIRAAVGVLLQDLERAMASERVGNLQVLMPGMATKDVTGWETFFRRFTRLTARYTVERLNARGDTAYA